MVDTEAMQIVHCIDDLEEDSLDESIVADILHGRNIRSNRLHIVTGTPTHALLFGDHTEQISVLTVVHDHVDQTAFLDDATHLDYVWVVARKLVQREFSALELSLPRVETSGVETLDCVLALPRGHDVHRAVDDTICTVAEDANELKPTMVDAMTEQVTTVTDELSTGHVV